MNTSRKNQEGAVAIYIALVITLLMLSGALVQSAVLSRQIRESRDVTQNERAFYASDSGIEAVLFDLKTKSANEDTTPTTLEDIIEYGDQTATFSAVGRVVETEDQTRSVPCIESVGTFGAETRRTALGQPGCEPQ